VCEPHRKVSIASLSKIASNTRACAHGRRCPLAEGLPCRVCCTHVHSQCNFVGGRKQVRAAHTCFEPAGEEHTLAGAASLPLHGKQAGDCARWRPRVQLCQEVRERRVHPTTAPPWPGLPPARVPPTHARHLHALHAAPRATATCVGPPQHRAPPAGTTPAHAPPTPTSMFCRWSPEVRHHRLPSSRVATRITPSACSSSTHCTVSSGACRQARAWGWVQGWGEGRGWGWGGGGSRVEGGANAGRQGRVP